MKLAYNAEEPTQLAKDVGGAILDLLLDKKVTYGQADAALTEAQRMLYRDTRPVSYGILHPVGSEPKS
ncbi:MAG: hypothetical protein IKM84_04440 [Oscillospiraceae bacterium]|nr:hypothetical protein [Oscillospiraceae bacterium]